MYTLVVGNAKSGIASADLLVAKGLTPVFFDIGDPFDDHDLYKKFSDPEEVIVYTGTLPAHVLSDINDYVVVADGIPMDDPVVKQLRVMGYSIVCEIDLASSFDRGRVLAVTGTKGKTTATTLLGKIVKDRTRNAFVVGDNLGSYSDIVCSTTKDSTTVVKACAHDLESIDAFHPKVSAIINIQPHYTKRYESAGEYMNIKECIMMNQTPDDHVILNYDDIYTRKIGMRLGESPEGPRPFFFSTMCELKIGLFAKGDAIVLRDRWGERELMKASELQVTGRHNLENVLTAMAMAYRYGIPTDSIVSSCKDFTSIADRVEYVLTWNGIRFYNNSRGTDVATAINGIEAMDRPTYLIGGGYDDGADYGEWIDSFKGRVKKLVLIGQTREKMASVAKEHGFYDYVYAEDLEEAVRICTSFANPGEAVLLSPACDCRVMYKDSEERGEAFRAIVERL